MYLYKIIRKDSPYNKYIKWFAEGVSEETGNKCSLGFRTRKEAEAESWTNGRVIQIIGKRVKLFNPAYGQIKE